MVDVWPGTPLQPPLQPSAIPPDPNQQWPGTPIGPHPSAPPVAPGTSPGTSSGTSPPSLYAEETEPPNRGFLGLSPVPLGRAAKGAAKTVVGLGVGAGQLAEDIFPSLNRLGDTSLAQMVKQWAQSPATSIAEEEGKLLPYLVSPQSALGKVAVGTGTALLTPTESGSTKSHLEDASWGAALTTALGVPGPAVANSRLLRHAVGAAINAAIGDTISQMTGHGHWGAGAGLLGHYGIGYELAKDLPKLLGKIPAAAAGKAGTKARETFQPEKGDEKSH